MLQATIIGKCAGDATHKKVVLETGEVRHVTSVRVLWNVTVRGVEKVMSAEVDVWGDEEPLGLAKMLLSFRKGQGITIIGRLGDLDVYQKKDGKLDGTLKIIPTFLGAGQLSLKDS